MASLHDAFAALVSHAASADVNAERQFVAFPNFYFPVDAADLHVEDLDAAYAFALKTNMIPDEAPQFALSGRFVWESYKDVLTTKVLPSNGAGQSYGPQFVEALARLGEPLTMPTTDQFYSTAVVPVNLDDPNAWTRVTLDSAAIGTLAAKLSPDHAAWLSRFNVLARLGGDFIDSVSFERLTLVIRRPWYSDAVFGWRFWDLPGKTISDGAENPRGLMPGVIAKMVLVRNLRVALAASLPPDVGTTVVFMRAPGAAAPADAGGSPIAHLPAFARMAGAADRSRAAFKAFSGSATPVAARLATLKKELGDNGQDPAAGPLGNDGTQKFHVPLGFDVTRAREFVTPLLAKASAARAALEAETAPLRAEVDRATMFVHHPPETRDHRGGATRIVPVAEVVAGWQQRLAGAQLRLQPKSFELQQAIAEETRLKNAVSVLDQLAAIPVDAQAYVLTCVCDRTPKAPNPDPSLFAPA